MLSQADALYGAAYNVLFERLDPDACVKREKHKEILSIAASINEWIATQPIEIVNAYRRAMTDVMRRATGVLENNERAALMREARSTIPVPPPPAS